MATSSGERSSDSGTARATNRAPFDLPAAENESSIAGLK
jgi:hypothetical protein